MGLVQNLKKTLNYLVDKILVAGSFHYIKHLAKQTTKKQDNSLPTESSPSPLTTENPSSTIVTSSQDTSERTTMTGQEPVDQARAWAIQRVQEMNTADNTEQIYDRLALMDEWYEWFDLDKMDGMDYLVLEDVTEESEL
jgi:hypothetical protein